MVFREKLMELRLARNLSQSQLAVDLGVNWGAIVNWEKGKQEPNYSMLVTIAKYFGVTTDYILGAEK